MIDSIVILFAALVVTVSYLVARNARSNGLPFWRSFILGILGFTGILLLFLKLVG